MSPSQPTTRGAEAPRPGRPFPARLPGSAAVVHRGQRAVDALIIGGQPTGRVPAGRRRIHRPAIASAAAAPAPARPDRRRCQCRAGHDAPCSSNLAVASTPSALVRSISGAVARRGAAGQACGRRAADCLVPPGQKPPKLRRSSGATSRNSVVVQAAHPPVQHPEQGVVVDQQQRSPGGETFCPLGLLGRRRADRQCGVQPVGGLAPW